MAEDFELVRAYRQHLKRGAALLDEGRFDDALHEVEQALALDAHSLPAQALRDRIRTVRMRTAPLAAEPASAPGRGFVPHGVNAASWRGFEQRITDRRVRALLDTANSAIVAGDSITARAALEEARDLRPDAPELADLEARLTAVPVLPPPATVSGPRIWMRAAGAAAMFLVGVSLLIGVEWLRPIDTITPASTVMVGAPAAAPARELRSVDAPPAGAIIEAEDGDESIPAIIMPPEPLLQPRGTTGTMPAVETRPVARNEPPPPADPAPVPALREVADDFVADPEVLASRPDVARAEISDAPAETSIARADVARADIARADVARTEVASGPAASPAVERRVVEARPAALPPAVVPAAAAPVPDQGGVEAVLRRYASAYRALDASAARAVWPSVDEKALARAFQNLSSQDVSFDDCDIDIRGEVANASCRGLASYVGKVGSREPRTESRTWQFELRRDGAAWLIEGVNARRLSAESAFRDR